MNRYSTTSDFIANAVKVGGYTVGDIIQTDGYANKGDRGNAQWKATGNVIAASQDPLALNDIRLSDASGNEFELVAEGVIDLNALGGTSASYQTIADNASLVYSQGLSAGVPTSAPLIVDTVAELKAVSGAQVGISYYRVRERANALFEVIAGNGTANGFNIIAHNTENISFIVINAGDIFPNHYGAGIGLVDDTLPLELAAADADTLGVRWDLNGSSFNISTQLTLPKNGLKNGGQFVGAGCKWEFSKLINNSNALITFDSLEIDSVWHSSFNGKIKVIGEVLIHSTNSSWGVFWNNFGDLEVDGELVIDVDSGQSVNENIFGVALLKSGLRIRGEATSGIRQCYGNTWDVLDTTGADMTSALDATTGWHVLNDSDLNETNTIKNWDAEVSGNRGVRGNWNIQGHTIDSTASNLAVTDRNWSIFGSTQTPRTDGDFIPLSSSNAAIGGEWDILDRDGEMPFSLTTFGVMADTTTISTDNIPSGIQNQVAKETSTAFSGYQINFDFTSEKTVVLAMWISGNVDFKQIETDGGVFTSGLSYPDPSGWRLYRVVCPSVTSFVRLYLNDGDDVSYKQVRINSYFASITKATMLPTKTNKTLIRGVLNDVPFNTNVNIPIPLASSAAANSQTSGVINVRVQGDSGGPAFVGVTALYSAAVSCSRFSGVTENVSISEIANITQGINTAATPVMTVTPLQAALNLQMTGVSADNISVFWEYDPIIN